MTGSASLEGCRPENAGASLFDFVMPALVAGIHVLLSGRTKDVDGRDKPGHDGNVGWAERK
jgi:hypothetical protein